MIPDRSRIAALITAASLTSLMAVGASGAAASHNTTKQISPGNGPFGASVEGISADGTRVFFETDESLAAGDTDSVPDIYERSGGTTTLISQGEAACAPGCGNGADDVFFMGASADGTRVFFETEESLVAGDTDSRADIYERSGGTTTLVSQGEAACAPGCGNGADEPSFAGSSGDGTRVFFSTNESLVVGDTDDCEPDPGVQGCTDVYEHSGGATKLVSAGANGAFDASFRGASADGTQVFFETAEPLVGGDTDSQVDVYVRAGETTTSRVSQGEAACAPGCGNGAFPAVFAGTSADGTRVFFSTSESLVAGDTDSRSDSYERFGGTPTLITQGSAACAPGCGNGDVDAGLVGSSADGTRAFFFTRESLVPGDTDDCDPGAGVLGCNDIYERFGGMTTLVSTGGNGAFEVFNFLGASTDGTRAFFRTQESLAPGDNDSNNLDIYEGFGGTTTLISTGPPGGRHAVPRALRAAETVPSAPALEPPRPTGRWSSSTPPSRW